MEELAITAVFAPFIPFVVSLIKNRRWPATVNMAIVAVVAFALATAAVLITGQLDFENGVQDPTAYFGAAAVAFTEATALYRLIIKGTVTGERLNETLSNVIWTVPPEAEPIGEALTRAFADSPVFPTEAPESAVDESDEPPAALPPQAESGATEPPSEITGSETCADCGFGPRHPEHLAHTQGS